MRSQIVTLFSILIAGLMPGATAGAYATTTVKTDDAAPSGEAGGPRIRRFAISMDYAFHRIPKDIEVIDVWFPMPPEDDYQKIFNRVAYAPYSTRRSLDEETGNRFLHMQGGRRGGVPMRVTISFDVERLEQRNEHLEADASSASAERGRKVRERWLGSDSGIVIDRSVKSKAAKVTDGAEGPAEKALAIYDFVVDDIKLIAHPNLLPGSGFGRLDLVLDRMKGTPIDLSAAFVGLCRASGIPARVVVGMKIPADAESGNLTGYHSWGEFWLDGIGWVPADPAEAQRAPSRRDYYFGSIDENRLTLSRGRDLMLQPPQSGEPIAFFARAYWEGAGAPMPAPQVSIEFEELEQIPPPPQVPFEASPAPGKP